MCPYFKANYNICNFFDTYQDGYQKEHYCMSSGEWQRCANYDRRSPEEKIKYLLR